MGALNYNFLCEVSFLEVDSLDCDFTFDVFSELLLQVIFYLLKLKFRVNLYKWLNRFCNIINWFNIKKSNCLLNINIGYLECLYK